VVGAKGEKPHCRPYLLDAAREIVNLCGFAPPEDPERIAALTAMLDGPSLTTSTNRALAARLEQNTADGEIAAPVMIVQGAADVVVPPAATDAYVDERCAAGHRLEYWTFAGRDHGTIVRPGTPLEAPLIAWTTARFGNEPQASGCARKSL
jgi:pimeloyl-ACP methyl ester carboxylesterase